MRSSRLSYLVLPLFLTGCFLDVGGYDRPEPDPSKSRIWPPVAYTGHDGMTAFMVPVSTDLSNFFDESEITWQIEDTGVATIAKANRPPQYPESWGTWAMVTAISPGTTKIIATAGEIRKESELIVQPYTPAQIALGDERYNNPTDPMLEGRSSCASCHLATGGADHSPTELAGSDDDAILLAIETGKYPDLCLDDNGASCTCGSSGCATVEGYTLAPPHMWNLTPEERDAIVPYLRSLPPVGF